MAVLKHVERIRVRVDIQLKRAGAVFIILFGGATRLVCHRRLTHMVTVLRRGRNPGPWKVGRRRKSVFKVGRRWP